MKLSQDFVVILAMPAVTSAPILPRVPGSNRSSWPLLCLNAAVILEAIGLMLLLWYLVPKLEDAAAGQVSAEKYEAWHAAWNFGQPALIGQYAESEAYHLREIQSWVEAPSSKLAASGSYIFWLLAACAPMVTLRVTIKANSRSRNRILGVCALALLPVLGLMLYVFDGFQSAI